MSEIISGFNTPWEKQKSLNITKVYCILGMGYEQPQVADSPGLGSYSSSPEVVDCI